MSEYPITLEEACDIINSGRPLPEGAGGGPPTFVYILRFDRYVKIGFTTNFFDRMMGIQRTLPGEMEIVGFRRGTVKDERWLLGKFKEYKTRGEWFRYEGELALWIEENCDSRTAKIKDDVRLAPQ